MSLAPGRAAAIRILGEVRRRDAYVRPVAETLLSTLHLSEEDSAFALRLSLGVTACVGVLDEAIDRFKTGRLEPTVRDALRLAAYELLFMGTEPRIAVHQGVEAARSARREASGLANAVLRRIADAALTFPWGDPASDLAALARLKGHPEWLVELLVDTLDWDRAVDFLDAGQEPPPLYMRLNPLRGDVSASFEALLAEGACPSACPPDDLAVVCGNPRAAVRSTVLREGRAVVTDAAAQVAPLALGASPGRRILEIAAGTGTKTLGIQIAADSAGGPADVTSVDVHRFKVQALAERLEALGVTGVRTAVCDATDADSVAALGTDFDAVLIDAPCSGLGALRRHPEARWRLTRPDIDSLVGTQSALLDSCARVVRRGGVVVYSTCSVARAENHGVVEGFEASEVGSQFVRRSIAGLIPEAWKRFVTPDGWFLSWPKVGGPDGHFVAALVRDAGESCA